MADCSSTDHSSSSSNLSEIPIIFWASTVRQYKLSLLSQKSQLSFSALLSWAMGLPRLSFLFPKTNMNMSDHVLLPGQIMTQTATQVTMFSSLTGPLNLLTDVALLVYNSSITIDDRSNWSTSLSLTLFLDQVPVQQGHDFVCDCSNTFTIDYTWSTTWVSAGWEFLCIIHLD